MTLDLVLQRLDDVCSRLEALHAAVDRLSATGPRQLPPKDCALVDALGDVHGAGTIKTNEIIALTRHDFGSRPVLNTALVDLVGPALNPQRIGLALRAIADREGRGARWRLTAPAKDGGTRVWCIGGLK